MVDTKPLDFVVVRPVQQQEVQRWMEYLNRYHYLGCRGIAGRSLRYVATIAERWVALLGWGSAALKCTARDRYIGWDDQTKIKRLYLVVNNVRFLMLPGVSRRNLASKVLSLNLKRLSRDFQAVYGHPVYLAETFVDVSKYRGSSYRAANWRYVGMTQGWSRSSHRYYRNDQPKAVYVYPLCKRATQMLCADFIAYDFQRVAREGSMKALRKFPVERLMGEIQQVQDPRKRRGIRHQVAVVLGIAVCAVICGARSFRAIGAWAQALRQQDLERFGSKRKEAPSEPTIRRVIQSIDAQEFDQRIGQWVVRQSLVCGKAVAIDGKTLRGSRDGDESAVHLLSAVVHKEGIVVGQQRVESKTNEITRVKPLLDQLDVQGSVVTADALLTQRGLAEYVVSEKQADYLFTVKENQPTLLDDISELEFKKKLRPPGFQQRTRPIRDQRNLGQ